MAIYLVDTNVLIDALNGKAEAKALLNDRADAGILACCAVTVAEVRSGVHPPDVPRMEGFLSSLRWYPTTRAVALRAGQIRYDWARKGVTLALADALIAATVIEHGLTLITDNRKHFPMPEITFYP